MERIFKNRGTGKRQVKLNESYFESIGDSVSLTAMLTHDSDDEDQDSVDEDYVGHDDSGMESSSSVESDNESIDAGSDMGIEKNQDDENGEGEGDVNESNGTITRGYAKDEIVVVDFSKWKALQPKVCCICQEKQKDNDNPLLICRNEWCEVGVHKECYGVLSQSTPKLGKSKWDSWKCHRCEAEALPHKTQCILCTYPFGAMKKYFQQDGCFAGWVHIICAMWADNADYDGDTVDNFTLDAVGCGGFRRNCSICESTESAGQDLDIITGYTKQCQIGTCKKWVHLSCAEKYNLIEEHEELHDTDPFFVCCLEHGSVQPPAMTEWAKWCSKQSKLARTESDEPFRMVTKINWVPKGHFTAQVADRDSEIRSLVSEFLNGTLLIESPRSIQELCFILYHTSPGLIPFLTRCRIDGFI
ncbi:hypothetical protein BKA69DRAFT_354562 [Paraphysoderma sedebokerense]|nr:hypothetical protein BKA69DRAFT_354562 [Paraphysoderma sedebokerense]